jgi:hypothetical protein
MKLSDVVKIIPQYDKDGNLRPIFSKTGKQQIEGAPEGITQEKQIFDLIVGLDLPITDKIGLLGEFGFVDFRNRIEKDDQELGLASFDDNRKKIGIRYGGDDDNLSGRVMYDPDTKNISLGISKKFAKGGRIGFKGGADMGTVADSQGNVGGQSVDISPTGDVRTSDKPPSAPDDRASDAQNFTNFLATQTNLKPKEIRRITGNQSFLERFGPNILRAAIYGFNPALGIGSLNARDVINLYDAFEAGKVISDEDLTLGKLGITSLAKGGRVNYQDGTEYNEDSKEKLKDLATKAVGKFDEITGVDQITSANFPGSFDAATGAPSDFRHQAASNLVAEALGKGKFGSLGYLSGGIGSFGLGTVKEIGDLVSGILDPNTSVKDAFSQAYEDTVSNFKGAFAPTGTTTEELYEKLLGDYEVKPNFAFNPLLMNLRADRARQIEEARKRALENIQNQRDSKPTTTVTGTTKPGTPGGRDTKPTTTVTGTTKPGTSGGFQKQERQTAREDRRGGQYGFASGGLARMLGE